MFFLPDFQSGGHLKFMRIEVKHFYCFYASEILELFPITENLTDTNYWKCAYLLYPTCKTW